MYSTREQAMGPVIDEAEVAKVVPPKEREGVRAALDQREHLSIEEIGQRLDTLRIRLLDAQAMGKKAFLLEKAQEYGMQQMIHYFGLEKFIAATRPILQRKEGFSWVAWVEALEPDARKRQEFYARMGQMARDYYGGDVGATRHNSPKNTMNMVAQAADNLADNDTAFGRFLHERDIMPQRNLRFYSLAIKFSEVNQSEQMHPGAVPSLLDKLVETQGDCWQAQLFFRAENQRLEREVSEGATALIQAINHQIDQLQLRIDQQVASEANPILERLQGVFASDENSPMLPGVADATRSGIDEIARRANAAVEPQMKLLQDALLRAKNIAKGYPV